MEDCNICFSKISNISEFKILGCHHKLCNNCYLHLQNNNCPYCRQPFIYSKEDLKQKNKLNINYNYTPPPQLFDNSIYLLDNNFNNSEIQQNNILFSRRERQKFRRRRRNLTDEEIKERRNIIRNKCKRKWLLKEGRQQKLNWYEIIL